MSLSALHRRYAQGSLFPRSVSATVDINAPSDLVWNVLIDFDSYHKWNTFIPKVEGRFEVGWEINLHVNLVPKKAPLLQRERINLIDHSSKKFYWGVVRFHRIFLVANRLQEVESLGGNRTRYRTDDRLSGLLNPLVFYLYGNAMKIGFEKSARDLKEYCERIHREAGVDGKESGDESALDS